MNASSVCFYAINTNKGGALLVSEEAGLGKTTILLKLVAEMQWNLGENFRCAFIDHPTLTIAQLMSQISSSLLLTEPHADKFVNLAKMKEQLTRLKVDGRQGRHRDRRGPHALQPPRGASGSENAPQPHP